MPHAPSVGDSQLSSSNLMSCCAQIDPDRLQRLQIELLHIVRRRLQDHLQLRVLVKPVRILAVAPVRGPPRWLRVRNLYGFGPSTRRNVSGDIVPAPTSTS